MLQLNFQRHYNVLPHFNSFTVARMVSTFDRWAKFWLLPLMQLSGKLSKKTPKWHVLFSKTSFQESRNCDPPSPSPKVILPFLLRLPWLHPLPMVFCLECLPAWSKLLETAIVQCQQQLVHNLLPRFTFGPSAKLCLAPLLITFSAEVGNPFFEVELQSLSFFCCKKLFSTTNLFC